MPVTPPPTIVEDATATSVSTLGTILTKPIAGIPPSYQGEDDSTTRINIGQHPTPPVRTCVVDKEAYKDCYNSDGNRGPFFGST